MSKNGDGNLITNRPAEATTGTTATTAALAIIIGMALTGSFETDKLALALAVLIVGWIPALVTAGVEMRREDPPPKPKPRRRRTT